MILYDGLLTEHEKRILVLIARGKISSAIAKELRCSVPSVMRSLSIIYRKLGVANATAAVYQATQRGIITLAEVPLTDAMSFGKSAHLATRLQWEIAASLVRCKMINLVANDLGLSREIVSREVSLLRQMLGARNDTDLIVKVERTLALRR